MSWESFEKLAWWFRLTYGGRPFWLFLAITMALTIAGTRLSRAGILLRIPAALRNAAAVSAIAIYAAIALWYLLLDGFFDHAEPSVAAVAWLFHVGKPIYHAADAAERYAHIYGPFAFVIPGVSLSWFGPGLVQAKLPSTAAGLLTIVMVYRLARSVMTRTAALGLAAVFTIAVMAFRNLSFWIRPDSFLMFFSAVALLGATMRRPILGALVAGVASGVMADLKLTGPLYALPALGILIATGGWRSMAIAGFAALATAIWPFLALDNASFENFRHWFEISARNGLRFQTLRQNIDWALFVLVPTVPLLVARLDGRLDRTRTGGLCGLALGTTAVVIAASKPGAGPDHVMPFLPAVFYLAALYFGVAAQGREQSGVRFGVPAFVLTASLIAIAQQVYLVTWCSPVEGLRLSADLGRFVDAHPNRTVAMGFSRIGELLGYVRPVLVFRTDAYPLDAPAIQEYQMSGLELPDATMRALANCGTEYWLFPKHGVPFSAMSIYPFMNRRPLFPDAFKQSFAQRYERVEDTQYFQVWRCRQGARATVQ
jgi:Dolichyl-phosphate-mannose-protein mannosyltransferase